MVHGMQIFSDEALKIAVEERLKNPQMKLEDLLPRIANLTPEFTGKKWKQLQSLLGSERVGCILGYEIQKDVRNVTRVLSSPIGTPTPSEKPLDLSQFRRLAQELAVTAQVPTDELWRTIKPRTW